MSTRRRLSLGTETPTVHRWAHRARVVNPTRPQRSKEVEQVEGDLDEMLRRLSVYYPGMSFPGADASRMGLTRLQRILREGTETTTEVASDDFIQKFRTYLHLLLDH